MLACSTGLSPFARHIENHPEPGVAGHHALVGFRGVLERRHFDLGAIPCAALKARLSSFWIGVPGDAADDRAATENEVGCLHFDGVKGRAHDD